MSVPPQIFNSISRMTVGLISKSVGGVKEYIYRGIQQLPIILASTSLVYAVATGSMAHMNVFLGMALVIPLVTTILQALVGYGAGKIWPNSIFWKRGGGDTCNMLPSGKQETLTYFDKNALTGGAVPSYWMMGISYFIGYTISNAVDSLLTPAAPGSSNVNHEKRNTHAIFVIVATVIFSALILFVRLYYMRGCEGSSNYGIGLSLFFATWGAGIGYGMYNFSKSCGARSSDLLGILSQILPPSATSPHPIVCAAT